MNQLINGCRDLLYAFDPPPGLGRGHWGDDSLSSIAPHVLFPGRTVLTVAEVAKALGFTKRHVATLIEEGKIKGVNGAGVNGTSTKFWRIPVSAYDAFILENQS